MINRAERTLFVQIGRIIAANFSLALPVTPLNDVLALGGNELLATLYFIRPTCSHTNTFPLPPSLTLTLPLQTLDKCICSSVNGRAFFAFAPVYDLFANQRVGS